MLQNRTTCSPRRRWWVLFRCHIFVDWFFYSIIQFDITHIMGCSIISSWFSVIVKTPHLILWCVVCNKSPIVCTKLINLKRTHTLICKTILIVINSYCRKWYGNDSLNIIKIGKIIICFKVIWTKYIATLQLQG